jgi:splicing factor 3B subunit 2
MGRMDIDYAVFEDAFLRYQTKPKLTSHGDLYYEGKVRSTHIQPPSPFRPSRSPPASPPGPCCSLFSPPLLCALCVIHRSSR